MGIVWVVEKSDDNENEWSREEEHGVGGGKREIGWRSDVVERERNVREGRSVLKWVRED
jgi:hypothetical protein